MMPVRRKLADNLKRVEQRIADACHRARRPRESVTLVAVTKNVTLDTLRCLVESGPSVLGENRVQELIRRAAWIRESLQRRAWDSSIPAIRAPAWHMVGHLQRNKVRLLLPWVEMIQSVDSLRLAEELDAECAKLGRTMAVLLEVNAGGEAAKTGVAVAATTHLSEQIHSLKHLDLRGLMTMAPLTEDANAIRHTFQRVRELYEEIISERLCGPSFRELSMGMSQDFEHAIEFGATFVRIGSALFEGIELAPEPAATFE